MNPDTKRAKSIRWYLQMPFEGEIRVIENEVSIWTDWQGERIYVTTRVYKSDTLLEVQDRLIADWEEKKEQVEKDNAEWENPLKANGFRGDNLTL